MPKYLSGRSKLTRQSGLSSDRYRYLSIENAEPNLGDPLVGISSVTAKPIPPGQQFIVVSVEGSEPGERYWIPNQGGIIPGSISVFDDNTLVGALSSITQLNFVGAAITASVSIASSNLATIRVFSPGNSQEIIFNTANEFSTSTKLKFDPSNGLLTAGDRIIVGAGGTVITTTGVGSVGIGTTNPTQELHLQGDLRLTGTIYDYLNQPGTDTQLLVKNALGGIIWVNQGTIRAGAGGTYRQVQFHNSAGLVDGALNFVFDEINNRIGIGSTQPKVLLDVLGISSFKGGTTIDNLNVTGVTTTRNLTVTGVSTVGFVTGTSAFFTGIVTATKFVGEFNASNLYVTGLSTFLQKVNVNSDLGVTGLTTTQNFQVYQSTTLNRLNATGLSTFTTVDINGGEIDVTRIGTQNLNVSGVGTFNSQVNINNLNVTGVGTFDNIKLDSYTISTNDGNLILDSNAGTTQINDVLYVNDSTESTSKENGSIVAEGGVGIEKDLNVGGQLNVGGATTLASAGGITTTGGDLYVKGDLYVSDDIFYDELFARNGYFTGIVSTKDLNVTGIATIATLGVTGLTTTKNLVVFDTVGIGTTNPLQKFQIGVANTLGVSTDGKVFVVTADAKVGIGTTNPTAKLDVRGDAYIKDDLTVDGGDVKSNTATLNLFNTNVTTANVLGAGTNIVLGSATGTTTIKNSLTVEGNTTLGNAAGDTVSFGATVSSNIIPSADATYNLGSANNRWKNIFTEGTIKVDESITTKNLNVTGIATIGTLGVTGLTTTKDLQVTGFSTFTNTIDANGGAYIDNIQIGISADNEIDTSTGNLILDSFGGTTTIDDQLIVSGISTFQGNVTIGDDANVDTVTFTSRVGSGITPSSDNTYDLGSSTLKWKDIHATTFNGKFVGIADTASQVSTGTTNGTTPYYLTFVASNNSTRGNEFLYTDAGISYNPSTNDLNISGIVTAAQLSTGASGTGVNITTNTISGPALLTIDPAAVGDNTGAVRIKGDLYVDGTQFIVNSTTIELADFIVGIASTATTDVLADGAGIKIGPDNTLTYDDTNKALKSSENFNLASGKKYMIDGVDIGTRTSFPTLTSIGILEQLQVTGISTFTNGPVLIGTGTPTGTALQRLQVTGGAYISDKVGIGVTNPETSLDIRTPAPSGTIGNVRILPSGNGQARYHLFNGGGQAEWIFGQKNASWHQFTISKLVAGSESDYFSITSDGNVGIGTTNPTSKLQVAGDVTPSVPNTYDLGTTSLKWNNVYATTFNGQFVGNADTASYATKAGLATDLEINATNRVLYQASNNNTDVLSAGDSGQLLQSNGASAPSWVTPSGLSVSRADYATKAGLATDLEINATNRVLYQASNNNTDVLSAGDSGQLLQSNGASAPSWVTATDLTVSKASYADNAGISTNLKGGTTGSIPYQTSADVTTFLADPNVNGKILTWNTNAPIWSDPTAISVGTASSLNVTTDTSSSPRYLVLSSTTSGITTALVDSGITYTPSTDLLTVSKIKPTQIQDTGGGTGTENYVLTANGSGGWSWSSVTGGGSPAIAGITIKDDTTVVGTAGAINTISFVGDDVTATASGIGATITFTTTAAAAAGATAGANAAQPFATAAGISSTAANTSATNAANSATAAANSATAAGISSTAAANSATAAAAAGATAGATAGENAATGVLNSVGNNNQVLYKNNIGIVTTSPNFTFNGTAVSVAGDITAFASDIRLKTNIEYIENAVDRVMKLSGFTYNFNEKGSELGFDSSVRYSGVSAQEVQEVLPEAVSPAPISNKYLTVQYDKLVPLLIEAIKEQQETIANLQNRLETLEGK